MAHDIGNMFYYGERPWHGLGTALSAPADIEDALSAGELDWEVELVPIVPEGEPDSTISHRKAVVRTDRAPGSSGRVIGVVHPGFRPLQNRAAAILFDSLLGRGASVYHTGGYLRHGEVVWLLARLPYMIELGGRDLIESYLLFSNSHDGSHAIDIRLTTIRVVCQNTLSLALSGRAGQQVFRRAHDGSFALLEEEAKSFFAFVSHQCDEARQQFDHLRKRRCESDAFDRFLGRLLPDPLRPATASRNKAILRAYETRLATAQRARAQVGAIFREGLPANQIAPEPHTLWGALNAVTAWVDHAQAIKGDRYAHMMFGAGDTLKSRALQMVTATTL